MGLLSTFSFIIIDKVNPFAFAGVSEGLSLFDNYLYFSFITLLTIGYGDIVPLTTTAKTAVILLGIVGNFYTIIVMGIVIGKYLVQNKSEK